jgi:cyclopropane fatty-acyl-phospholipid synthase-like methyltransferase
MLRAALLALLVFPLQAKPSLDIHYVPTPPAVVDAMLALAGVTASDVVYDLGSGDGRIVIEAAQRHGARGVGIELDPELIRTSTAKARTAAVADRVRFVQADIFKADLSEATVVTMYLSPATNLRIRERLRQHLRPGTRIVSHRFDMGDWKPEQERLVGDIRVFLWTVAPR